MCILGALVQTIRGYETAEINTVAFSPDGRTIASASDHNTFHLYDVQTGKVRYKLVGNNGSDVHTGIDFVNFSPDGSKLATASRDRSIRLWDAHKGDLIQVLNGHRSHVLSVEFSPRR